MQRKVTIYHSPDADDAFMFYGLAKGHVVVPGFEFEHMLSDIESLNHRAIQGELEATAVSVHAFSHLKNRYLILKCGASMGGRDYGPRLIARPGFVMQKADFPTIAIPGTYTSASLALRLWLAEQSCDAELVTVNFERIPDAVAANEVDCGLVIHEAQLTHAAAGFSTILDLGQWWWEKHSLPLPLGVNVVRRDIGQPAIAAVSSAIKSSIDYSLAHREEALEYALSYGRGISRSTADEFVSMYVNERTQGLGADGEKSIRLFLEEGFRRGFCPGPVSVDFI